MFWKEVKWLSKGTVGKDEMMKSENGAVVMEKDAVRKRWPEVMERLLMCEDREPVVVVVGREKTNMLG